MRHDLINCDCPAAIGGRRKCRVNGGQGSAPIFTRQFAVGLVANAACEQFELIAKHIAFGNGDVLPRPNALTPWLQVKSRIAVELLGRRPFSLVDLVEHHRFVPGDPNAVSAGTCPVGDHHAEFSVGKGHRDDPLILDLCPDRGVLRRDGVDRSDVAAEKPQRIELMDGNLAERSSWCSTGMPAPVLRC